MLIDITAAYDEVLAGEITREQVDQIAIDLIAHCRELDMQLEAKTAVANRQNESIRDLQMQNETLTSQVALLEKARENNLEREISITARERAMGIYDGEIKRLETMLYNVLDRVGTNKA